MFATDDEKSLIFRPSLAMATSSGKGSSTSPILEEGVVHGLPLSTERGYKLGDRKQIEKIIGKCWLSYSAFMSADIVYGWEIVR